MLLSSARATRGFQPVNERTGNTEAPRWEHFHHVADIGVRGYGNSLAQAFEQAAVALTAVLTDPDRVRETAEVQLRCSAPDPELLLAEWLNALIYEMGTRRLLFKRFAVHIVGETLEGRAWGEPVDRRRHAPAVEVKGATYTELRVAHRDDGTWIAQCVIDV
jgi:tRNA nucleotidyltransferase (CCA-adding enzyme)